ncbi:MAG: serine hydrolase [Actinomycetota bacterium]|jgi:CubicO group peptidase (beta-lactamase class C family)|nr:serine hydrolase [Actinomycetota bacterium]
MTSGSAVTVDMGEAGVVRGVVAEGFEPVLGAFVANFARRGECGAGVCVYRHGRPVVDLYGGWAQPRRHVPYDDQTLQLVFSTTKGATALCAHLAAQRGLCDLDAPVTELWPELTAGARSAPARWLLTHQIGLPTIDATLSLDQALAWAPVVDALEHQAPYWEPGTAHGYHALTFGWLVGELVRRATGRNVGRYFADEVAAPLGLEFWIGLPPEEHHRVAPLRLARLPTGQQLAADPASLHIWAEMLRPGALGIRALTLNGTFGAFGRGGPFNTPELWAAQVPAANGITNARSLARLYAAMIGPVDGVQLLDPAQRRLASTPQATGPDRVLMTDTCFGLGFQCQHPASAPLLGPGSFGHSGAGGSLGFAHPDSGTAFGYVMNQLRFGLQGDDRTARLVEALRSCP